MEFAAAIVILILLYVLGCAIARIGKHRD